MKACRILIIDDDPLLLRALKAELRREPYQVHLAENASEAVRILYENEIDIVLTDHHMPERTGLDFLCELKGQFPNIVRGLITGQPDLRVYMKAVNDGQVHFLLAKPWDSEELLGTIRLAYARKQADDMLRSHEIAAAPPAPEDEELIRLRVDHPGIMNVRRDITGAIAIDEDSLS